MFWKKIKKNLNTIFCKSSSKKMEEDVRDLLSSIDYVKKVKFTEVCRVHIYVSSKKVDSLSKLHEKELVLVKEFSKTDFDFQVHFD